MVRNVELIDLTKKKVDPWLKREFHCISLQSFMFIVMDSKLHPHPLNKQPTTVQNWTEWKKKANCIAKCDRNQS